MPDDARCQDSFDSMVLSVSMLVGLEELAHSNSKLIEKLEEESNVDPSMVEHSEVWRLVRGINISNHNAYVSNPWAPWLSNRQGFYTGTRALALQRRSISRSTMWRLWPQLPNYTKEPLYRLMILRQLGHKQDLTSPLEISRHE